MPVKYTAFKGSESGEISKQEITRKEVGNDEVLVRIEFSGVCGTDQHMKHKDMVLGHEGVGVVEAVGKDVSRLKLSVIS
jgi:D-arabinose 1-dehydrogenase-like Zn-dependent alcohol dehydrogenase